MRKYKVRLLGLGIAVLLGASTPMNVLAEVDSEEIILEESAIKEASAQEEQQEDLKNKADDAENEKVEDQEQKNPEQESSQDTKQESDTFEHEELLKDKEVIKKDEAAEREQPKDLEERTEENQEEKLLPGELQNQLDLRQAQLEEKDRQIAYIREEYEKLRQIALKLQEDGRRMKEYIGIKRKKEYPPESGS